MQNEGISAREIGFCRVRIFKKKKDIGCPVSFNLVLAEIVSSDPRNSSSTVRNCI